MIEIAIVEARGTSVVKARTATVGVSWIFTKCSFPSQLLGFRVSGQSVWLWVKMCC